MAEEVGIVMSLYDRVSPTLKAIAGNTAAFDKNLDDLESSLKEYDKAQDALSKNAASLRKALEASNQKVADARKEYRKLKDDTSKGTLDAAIDEQARLKRELAETETSLKINSRAYEDLYDKARKAANGIKDVTSESEKAANSIKDAATEGQKADNRAASGGVSGGADSILSALGKAGLLDMAGDVAMDAGNLLIGSAFGSEIGSVAASGLSGALSGAAMGSLVLPGIGTAVGAAIGGGLGLIQGGTQVAQERDEAFKQYYSDQYDQAAAATEESLSSGGDTASQRELDAIAFNRLLGEGVGDQYLSDLRRTAADTPMEYGDLTSISRSLATGFGDTPERMLELITAIGDAGSAVGVTASDMDYMAQAMSRMQSSGKATLEYLQIFQDRGVDVIGMLSDAMGKTQGEIYEMISDGAISGKDAVTIIQQGMESLYGGAMETMSQTFDGLTSTLQDAMTEIDNAMGEGYNEKAKEGIQADIDAYGGALGEAMAQANSIIGEGRAIAENLSRQYDREAMEAVTMGTSTTVYGDDQATKLQEMHDQYTSLVDQYQTATEEDKAVIAAQIEALMEDAQTMAESNYNASETAQQLREVELEQIDAIRANTAALGSAAWSGAYSIQQEQSKGIVAGQASSSGFNLLNQGDAERFNQEAFATQDAIWSKLNGHAVGLDRVPYDDYPTLLHEGERVLTAREAREQDRADNPAFGGSMTAPELREVSLPSYESLMPAADRTPAPASDVRGDTVNHITVNVSGNTFGAGMDEAAVAEAIADTAVRKILAGFQG